MPTVKVEDGRNLRFEDGTTPLIDAPPVAVKRHLIEQEIALWTNTRYQAEVRLRVQKRIDGDAEVQATLMKDMERCEKALDALREELEAL